MNLPRDNYDEWKKWSVEDKDKAIQVLSGTTAILLLITIILIFKS